MTVLSDTSLYIMVHLPPANNISSVVTGFFCISFRIERMTGMSNFNANKSSLATYEGGKAYKKPLIVEWLNTICSTLCSCSFYENKQDREQRVVELTEKMVEEYGAHFVAKSACVVRNVFGIRSASHIIAAVLNNSQFDSKKHLYKLMFRRPDDIAEIFAASDWFGYKKSHALLNAAKQYVSNMRPDEFGKYTLKGKDYNWFDIINITHAHSSTIDKIKSTGKIPQAATWENVISNTSNKEESWRDLVVNRNLHYIALLRNLNNICSQPFCNESFAMRYLCPMLIDYKSISKSLVFPYQIYSAYKNAGCQEPWLKESLNIAFRKSVYNLPEFEGGQTLIVFDVSASMLMPISSKSSMSILEASACMAYSMFVATRGQCLIVKFADESSAVDVESLSDMRPMDAIASLCTNDNLGYGTEIGSVATSINKTARFKRAFVFSDMQTVDSCTSKTLKKYADYIYSYDLGGYDRGSLNFGDDNIFQIVGLNDTMFKMIPYIESGKHGLEEAIEDYAF